MDPLSIAASVAGLLTLAIDLVSKGYACITEFKRCKSDLSTSLNELAAFFGIVGALKAQLDNQTNSNLPGFIADQQDVWVLNLDDCEKTIKKLQLLFDFVASVNKAQLMIG